MLILLLPLLLLVEVKLALLLVVLVKLALLLLLSFVRELAPIIEVMAATRAAVKFGSAAMAAVAALRESESEFCCPTWFINSNACG